MLVGIISYTNAQETALDRYIAKPDPNYSYFHHGTDDDFLFKSYFIRMISQQWRSSAEVDRPLWEHDVEITVPLGLGLLSDSPETAILLINGGSNSENLPSDANEALGVIATALGVVVAVVEEIPNQPLFSPTKTTANGPRTKFSPTVSISIWIPAMKNGRFILP
ncbi:MAG: hypothetical protein HC808_05205 [Candidatus Competibacteraceae bacterium]|nr:hypothetical protein [Candidatus Competibacteraceae bacterium]